MTEKGEGFSMAENDGGLLYSFLEEISEQTKTRLGEQTAGCFVDLHDDWLSISAALSAGYDLEEVSSKSLLCADFLTFIPKDLLWLHRLLLWGNYPLIYRTLRYDWELIFRGFFADTFQPNIPADPDIPGLSLNEKIKWLEKRESSLHFANLIKPILRTILPTQTAIDHYRGLWTKLNQFVHATTNQPAKLICNSSTAVTDAFDEKWAQDAITDACQAFDIIWLLMLVAFPKSIAHLKNGGHLQHTPISRILIANDMEQF